MLLVNLMFHQVYHPDDQGCLERFEAFAKDLHENFICVTPGQALIPGMKHVSLTFDDAYADFYFEVYPILEKYKLTGIVGIPTQKISNFAPKSIDERLAIKYPRGLDAESSFPLMTWQELKDLAKMPYVRMAAHGHAHIDVLTKPSLWQQEITEPKKVIADKLGITPEIFIYPFGKTNRIYHEYVKRHYNWAYRIGGAVNFEWPESRLLYRIDADPIWRTGKKLSQMNFYKQTGKYLLNRIRQK